MYPTQSVFAPPPPPLSHPTASSSSSSYAPPPLRTFQDRKREKERQLAIQAGRDPDAPPLRGGVKAGLGVLVESRVQEEGGEGGGEGGGWRRGWDGLPPNVASPPPHQPHQQLRHSQSFSLPLHLPPPGVPLSPQNLAGLPTAPSRRPLPAPTQPSRRASMEQFGVPSSVGIGGMPGARGVYPSVGSLASSSSLSSVSTRSSSSMSFHQSPHPYPYIQSHSHSPSPAPLPPTRLSLNTSHPPAESYTSPTTPTRTNTRPSDTPSASRRPLPKPLPSPNRRSTLPSPLSPPTNTSEQAQMVGNQTAVSRSPTYPPRGLPLTMGVEEQGQERELTEMIESLSRMNGVGANGSSMGNGSGGMDKVLDQGSVSGRGRSLPKPPGSGSTSGHTSRTATPPLAPTPTPVAKSPTPPPSISIPVINFPGDAAEDDFGGGGEISIPVPSFSLSSAPSIEVSSTSTTPSFSFSIDDDSSPALSAPSAPILSSTAPTKVELLPGQPGIFCSLPTCERPIIGRILTAMGRRFHPECFSCKTCGMLLEHVSSYENEGEGYCHMDYFDQFAPKCHHCSTSIVDSRFVTIDDPALGGQRYYHELHFFCAECGDPFLEPSKSSAAGTEFNKREDGEEEEDQTKPFVIHGKYAYCEECDVKLHKPKCTGCRKPMRGEAVVAMGGKWHRECFRCGDCDEPFVSTSFFPKDGKALCQDCYTRTLDR